MNYVSYMGYMNNPPTFLGLHECLFIYIFIYPLIKKLPSIYYTLVHVTHVIHVTNVTRLNVNSQYSCFELTFRRFSNALENSLEVCLVASD